METMYEIFGIGGTARLWETVSVVALVAMRLLPIMFLTPFMGGRLAPPETRIGLTIGLVALSYPFVLQQMKGPVSVNQAAFLALMFKEVFLGMVIGFLASALFYAMEIGGRALDILRGSNMAEVQVPELQLRASPIGQFNFQFLLVVFCALNGHGFFIESIITSFQVVPIDAFPKMQAGFLTIIEEIIRHTADLFPISFGLVFPGMFASFVVDVVFGMFNRIAPQLNAYFMAMGVKAMSGLAMFFFALSLMIDQLSYRLQDSLVFIRDLIQLFA
jgi:flagellar biosynthesis protein FliR